MDGGGKRVDEMAPGCRVDGLVERHADGQRLTSE